MDLHLLRFSSQPDLLRSFDEATSKFDCEDCLVQVDRCELRVRAPDEVIEQLIEHAYQHGGLAWHSRHREAASDD